MALPSTIEDDGMDPSDGTSASANGSEDLLPCPHTESTQALNLEYAEQISSLSHRYLYTSHFLSAWNSRMFEFGAYIFLGRIYPETLLPASVYALSRATCAALFSPSLGYYVDCGNRLQVVRLSIGIGWQSATLLIILCALAVLEKLSSVLNTISIERDWVVVIARDREDQLRLINSQMRRIDLFCKLAGPLAISFVDTASTKAAIIVTGAMTCLSVLIEYLAIAKVYKSVPALRTRKMSVLTRHGDFSSHRDAYSLVRTALSNTATYLRHPAFLPSFALALLYVTVLSFSGQMVTYLLALGISSGMIGILRGIAALSELSATWISPLVMKRIGAIRSGSWFINWQIICVAAACFPLWLDGKSTIAALGTVCAVIASRVGLWGFDLGVQLIIQEEVEAELRGTFSSQEFAFQNAFEMLSFTSTIVFAEPNEFKIPATISASAVALAGILYAAFVRSRRGHLVHLCKCIDRHHQIKHGWSAVPQIEQAGRDMS